MSPDSGHFGVSVGQIMMIITMIPGLRSASPGPAGRLGGGQGCCTPDSAAVILAKIADGRTEKKM